MLTVEFCPRQMTANRLNSNDQKAFIGGQLGQQHGGFLGQGPHADDVS